MRFDSDAWRRGGRSHLFISAMTRRGRCLIKAVLFDLDGTLADTAPDMTSALNRVLAEDGRPPLALARVRNHVSRGAAGVIRAAYGDDLAWADFERLRERFLALYAVDLCKETRLFAGAAQVLTHIERLGLKWGVVTNKPACLTDPLIETLGLAKRAACVVSGDTTSQRKPHPEPLLHASARCMCRPAQCVYIGDDPRDIQAGQAAGMTTLVALYGYIDAAQNPRAWGASATLADIRELLDWLRESAPAEDAAR